MKSLNFLWIQVPGVTLISCESGLLTDSGGSGDTDDESGNWHEIVNGHIREHNIAVTKS